MTYLMIFDDSKSTPAQKIAGACERYADRFGARATVVLVNEKDRTDMPGIRVEVRATVQPNNIWIGEEG